MNSILIVHSVNLGIYRDVGYYVIKKCVLVHEGHVVNGSSILIHARIESDLTEDEKNQLPVFGKMDSTA